MASVETRGEQCTRLVHCVGCVSWDVPLLVRRSWARTFISRPVHFLRRCLIRQNIGSDLQVGLEFGLIVN